MNLKWKIFIGLVIVAIVLVVLSFVFNDIFGPILAGTILIPAILLSKIGLPTLTKSTEWGWAGPSIFGLAIDVVIYLTIFYLIARIATRFKRQG